MTAPTEKRDVCGMVYDNTWTGSDGTQHYSRRRALGRAEGPAQWSSEDDCNRICGHHLAAKCLGCNVCMTCDGCYCREGREDYD